MAGTQINIAEARAAVTQIEELNSRMTKAFSSLNNIATELGSSWKGAAYAKFEAQHQDMQTKFRSAGNNFDNIHQGLKTTLNQYESIDQGQ